jgi:hypothetical protein
MAWDSLVGHSLVTGETNARNWTPPCPVVRAGIRQAEGMKMARPVVVVLYAIAMAAVIVGVDLAFFRNRFWERLMANVGIVLVFGAFYLRFFGRPWSP